MELESVGIVRNGVNFRVPVRKLSFQAHEAEIETARASQVNAGIVLDLLTEGLVDIKIGGRCVFVIGDTYSRET